MSDLESEAKSSANSGLSQLLFGPVYLIGEAIGFVLPGVLFCLGLLLKGQRAPFAAFDLTFLGYRTRVFVFLLIAFVVGKILTSPLRLILDSLSIEKGKVA